MTDKETKRGIIDILEKTFDVIDQCYGVNDELNDKANYSAVKTRLIFPCRYNPKGEKLETRISEQELRFLFIEQFIQYCQVNALWRDAYYSIEAPTKLRYKFSEGDKQHKERMNTPHKVEIGEEGGQSAMIDVCIHDNTGERICLIEFKYGNPEQFCFEKDLVKLKGEGGLGFFVHLLKSQQENTLGCVLGKVETVPIKKDSQRIDKAESFVDSMNYICHTLPKKESDNKGRTQFISKSAEEYSRAMEKENAWERIILSAPSIKKQIAEYKEKLRQRKTNS